MAKLFLSILCIAVFVFALEAERNAVQTARAADASTSKLDELGWLVGRWHTKTGDELFEEQWMSPKGNMMLGMGREMKGDKLSFFEYLRIEKRENGIFYVAQPFGKSATDFELTGSSNSVWTFENPEHDFPKKIVYDRSKKDGTLIVRGSGVEKDKAQAFEFRLYKER